MANENEKNSSKNIDQTESSKRLRDGVKCAEAVAVIATVDGVN